MELNVGIKHIIDGNAIIIMGAGASYGAKNAFGDFPSGSRLASELYKKCDIYPDEMCIRDSCYPFPTGFHVSGTS